MWAGGPHAAMSEGVCGCKCRSHASPSSTCEEISPTSHRLSAGSGVDPWFGPGERLGIDAWPPRNRPGRVRASGRREFAEPPWVIGLEPRSGSGSRTGSQAGRRVSRSRKTHASQQPASGPVAVDKSIAPGHSRFLRGPTSCGLYAFHPHMVGCRARQPGVVTRLGIARARRIFSHMGVITGRDRAPSALGSCLRVRDLRYTDRPFSPRPRFPAGSTQPHPAPFSTFPRPLSEIP